MAGDRVELSVVVPAYNEGDILERSTRSLCHFAAGLGVPWELLLVDDGSSDASLEILRSLERQDSRLRVLQLPGHQGRGSALRLGLLAARGRVLLTTEIDGSWDEAGLRALTLRALCGEGDVFVASPHRAGGGFSGVPFSRRILSRAASLATRLLLGRGLTMSTGMTRAYRAEVLPAILSDRTGKEFHVDVLCRALQRGLRIVELPVRLRWESGRARRRSAGALPQLLENVWQHLSILVRYRAACCIPGRRSDES